MNRWPDGSVRWAEIDTVLQATEQTRTMLLDVGQSAEPIRKEGATRVTVRSEGKRVRISTGTGELVVGGKSLIERMSVGKVVLEGLVGRIEMDGREYRPVVESVKVLAEGPVRGEAEVRGTMRADKETLGRFVFRASAFAGLPYVRLTWRVFNDRSEAVKIKRFELLGRCALGGTVTTTWGSTGTKSGGNVRVQQLVENRFEVWNGDQSLETGTSAAGWLAAQWEGGTLLAAVRNFREQFPKALEIDGGRLRIALFESSPEREFFLPTEGEAKRHEIWLGLWDRRLGNEELTKTARFFARPGWLFDADYFCRSGGFGYAAVHDETSFAELTTLMRERYKAIEAKQFYAYDIRDWGDQIYNKDSDYWCNGYYDRQQGFASEYLMSGDGRWFDRLEATVRHVMDIDVCHSSAAHPNWVGSIHSYNGANHTGAAPWNAMQRTKGMLAYWRLTGDVDARTTALGVADSALRENRGIGAGSVRAHAGVLYCLTSAYDETGDVKYLEGAKRVAHDSFRRIDRRRGCYVEIHGNVSYRGNVPWMCAQLAEPMYEYYRQSGDVEAAKAVVGLAESIITENCTRGVWGDVYGYSHNPHFKKTSRYHVLIGPTVMYAYELTGDEAFLKHGRAMYRQTLAEDSVNAINNCYWNVPTFLYYLSRFGGGGEGFRR